MKSSKRKIKDKITTENLKYRKNNEWNKFNNGKNVWAEVLTFLRNLGFWKNDFLILTSQLN